MSDDKIKAAASRFAASTEAAQQADLELRESESDALEAEGEVRLAEARLHRARIDIDIRRRVATKALSEREAAARELHNLTCPGCTSRAHAAATPIN